MPTPPVHNTTPDLPDEAIVNAETHERPALLYLVFPVISMSDFLREIPDRWLILNARAKDKRR